MKYSELISRYEEYFMHGPSTDDGNVRTARWLDGKCPENVDLS